MTEIPADIMEAATRLVASEQVRFHAYGTVITDTGTVEAIARAIMAERLAERERCAAFIEQTYGQGYESGPFALRATFTVSGAEGYLLRAWHYPAHIAAAIRGQP